MYVVKLNGMRTGLVMLYTMCRQTETVRAAQAEQRPQVEPLNLRMARQEDDMCCGQRVERGLLVHLLCAITHGTLSRITYSSQSEASSARVSRKGKSATHATSDHHSGEVRNQEKQSCPRGNCSKHQCKRTLPLHRMLKVLVLQWFPSNSISFNSWKDFKARFSYIDLATGIRRSGHWGINA